jgi:hypothetical protein
MWGQSSLVAGMNSGLRLGLCRAVRLPTSSLRPEIVWSTIRPRFRWHHEKNAAASQLIRVSFVCTSAICVTDALPHKLDTTEAAVIEDIAVVVELRDACLA